MWKEDFGEKRRGQGKGAFMGQWFQRFVAGGVHGEVNDATIQGYLRSASQLEDVWQQIDDKVDAFILQGMAPWEAYAKMAYALAFVRACRMIVVFVQELLKANAMANPTNASYLPKVTYEQALALCEHIEPFIEEAVKAATSPENPNYLPHLSTLPFALGPRVGYANQHIPLSHLQGFLGAAQQMRDWTAGLLAKYELTLHAAKSPVPQPVATHIEEMNRELGLGDFHLRTGIDMAGQISNGQVTDELSAKAIGFLWEAMESFFKLSQLIAFSGVPVRPQQQHSMKSPVPQYQDRRSDPAPRQQPPIAATPPEPDVADLLNQVTAGPSATLAQAVPTPPTPDVSNMLNQVTASQEVEQAKPNTPSSSAISAMFDQVTTPPETIQAGPLQPRAKGSQETEQVPHPDTALPEDDIMKMFSDVCSDQQPKE